MYLRPGYTKERRTAKLQMKYLLGWTLYGEDRSSSVKVDFSTREERLVPTFLE